MPSNYLNNFALLLYAMAKFSFFTALNRFASLLKPFNLFGQIPIENPGVRSYICRHQQKTFFRFELLTVTYTLIFELEDIESMLSYCAVNLYKCLFILILWSSLVACFIQNYRFVSTT